MSKRSREQVTVTNDVSVSIEAPPIALMEVFEQLHKALGSPDVQGLPVARIEIGYDLTEEELKNFERSAVSWWADISAVRARRIVRSENGEVVRREYCDLIRPSAMPMWARTNRPEELGYVKVDIRHWHDEPPNELDDAA
jgi:hypothetical protein